MSAYRYMSLADKRRHAARGSPDHPGRSYRPEPKFRPALARCAACRAQVPVEQAAAHLARCPKK